MLIELPSGRQDTFKKKTQDNVNSPEETSPRRRNKWPVKSSAPGDQQPHHSNITLIIDTTDEFNFSRAIGQLVISQSNATRVFAAA